jgi:uncharacterized protein (TIGR02265 family)
MVSPSLGKVSAHSHTLAENDWNLPLDVEAQLRMLPREGWIRGVFPDTLVKRLDEAGIPHPEFPGYHVLAKYPLDEYTRLIAFAAQALHPDLPLRHAVRMVGQCIYPAFFASMVGKAIFAVAGKDFKRAVEVAPKAYKDVGISPGASRVLRVTEGYAYAELRDVWGLSEAFQVGIWEGALLAFGLTGSVRARVLTPSDVDLECVWRPR